MKKEKFIISEDFILNRIVESIIIDVKYEGYDLDIIIEYEMEDGKIIKFDVYTGADKYRYGNRYFAFGIDNRLNEEKIETMEDMINLVYSNFLVDNIGFYEVIELIEEEA